MNEPDERDAQIIAEPLDPTDLEEALSADSDDRSTEEWDLIELAAEKWLSGHDSDLERSTGDIQAQAERPPSMRDNFSDDEIAAAFRDVAALRAQNAELVAALVACRPHILSGQVLMQIDAALADARQPQGSGA